MCVCVCVCGGGGGGGRGGAGGRLLEYPDKYFFFISTGKHILWVLNGSALMGTLVTSF